MATTTILIPGSSTGTRAFNTLLNGRGNPPDSAGERNDFWLNTTTTTLFGPKRGDAWPTEGVKLIGGQGEAGTGSGNRIFWGTGAPSDDLNPGPDDLFIDTASLTIYRAS